MVRVVAMWLECHEIESTSCKISLLQMQGKVTYDRSAMDPTLSLGLGGRDL
jgi:hypothetical protein